MATEVGVALRIFEEAMRIADLWILERRPESAGAAYSYLVGVRDDPSLGAWCLIRDEDSEVEPWSVAADIVREIGQQRRLHAQTPAPEVQP